MLSGPIDADVYKANKMKNHNIILNSTMITWQHLRDYFLLDISIPPCWCQVINNSQGRTHSITCTGLKTLNSSSFEHKEIPKTENISASCLLYHQCLNCKNCLSHCMKYITTYSVGQTNLISFNSLI